MSFDKVLFIPFDKGWHKALAAIFTSLGRIISKPTAFFVSSTFKSLNNSSGFVPQTLLGDVIEGIWFLEVVLTRLTLKWSKCDWTIKSIARVVSETILSRGKWLGFFPDAFWQYLCNVSWTSQPTLSYLWLLYYQIFMIISSPLIWPLFVRKSFIMLQKFLFVITPVLEIFLRYFLIHFFLWDTHLFHCILYFFLFFLVGLFGLFLAHKRGFISSDKSLFQRCMTFDNLNESLGNEAIILIWIICWQVEICFFQVI